jgi:hypothetical protein
MPQNLKDRSDLGKKITVKSGTKEDIMGEIYWWDRKVLGLEREEVMPRKLNGCLDERTDRCEPQKLQKRTSGGYFNTGN